MFRPNIVIGRNMKNLFLFEHDPGGLDGEEGGVAVLGRVAGLPRGHVVELGRLERADQLERRL